MVWFGFFVVGSVFRWFRLFIQGQINSGRAGEAVGSWDGGKAESIDGLTCPRKPYCEIGVQFST